MKNITKKDVLIFACLGFVFYKLNGITFNIAGKSMFESLPEKTVDVMDKVLKLISEHPLSSTFAFVNPLVIPPVYHSVLSQILLGLGIQTTMFIFEFLRKKAKIKARKADIEQTIDEYLDGIENPTKFR